MDVPRVLLSIIAFLQLLLVTAAGVGDHSTIIGIDLGTTFSCAAVYRNGHVEIIPNSQGGRTTPSWVSFRGEDWIVGEAAKHSFHAAPTQTVYSIKRIIGRSYGDPILNQEIAAFPFGVVNKGGRPTIEIDHEGATQHFSPEQISAIVLSKMKQTAEAYLGARITHAVVTVPAYFNDAQRQATKDAGRIAGLEIVRMVNEPTAAALAYALDKKRNKPSRIIVYDLGGGTLDVSLLSFREGAFKVVATSGNDHLGGEDFSTRIVDHFLAIYHATFGYNVSSNVRSMTKLKKEAERIKLILSHEKTVTLDIESFHMGNDFSGVLTRAKFEQLNQDLFDKALEPVRQVLSDAKLGVTDIDEIVLVGGSTRIPKIQAQLSAMFRGKALSQGVNPDEAVAMGAAVYAGILSRAPGLEDFSLADVCPFTIGIETAGGKFAPFIRRNTPVPAIHSERLSTIEDNQRTVLIQVFEGEHADTTDNHLIGQFELAGIPAAARGIPQIDVQFEIDANGILRVEAKEHFTGKSNSIVISSQRNGLTEEELARMTTTSKVLADQDTHERERTEKVNEIQRFLWDFNAQLKRPAHIALMAQNGQNATIVAGIVRRAMVWMDEKGAKAPLSELEDRFELWKAWAE